MNPKIIILLMLFHLPGTLPAKDWFPGFVRLKNNRVLRGEIDVRPECDAVLFRYDDAEMVYPAHKISHLSFYDEDVKENRTFVSLRHRDGAATMHELYELILNGDISVLRKELSSWQAQHFEMEDFEYFVFMNDELYEMKAFKRKFYSSLLNEFSFEIKELSRKGQLDYHSLPRIVQVISLINEARKIRSQAKAD